MRGAGCDHGIENRFSMCGLIWQPRPRMNRPFEYGWRSFADVRQRHRVAGERDRDAGAELDALGVLAPATSGQERVVAGLGGDQTPS